MPIWDSFLLVARSLNNFWYFIRLEIQSCSLSFFCSTYTFYLTCLDTTFIAFLKFDLVFCLPLSSFINFSWHSLLSWLLLLWCCWFCAQVHFVFRYILCSSIFCVHVHCVFRYILCSSTFCVPVHFLSRYILCSSTFCVQVHSVFRYILCSGTFCVPVHFVSRYILCSSTFSVIFVLLLFIFQNF